MARTKGSTLASEHYEQQLTELEDAVDPNQLSEQQASLADALFELLSVLDQGRA